MAYYIKKAELAMLEEVKIILERNMQEADKEIYSAFCEFIATNKAYKSRNDGMSMRYQSTPEGKQKHRESSLRSYYKSKNKKQ